MKLIRAFLVIWGALLLSNVTFGAENRVFLDRHRAEIQEYIMTGHERGWKNCDILSANTLPHDREPHVSMDLEHIKSHFQRKTEKSLYRLHSDKSQKNVIVGPFDSP